MRVADLAEGWLELFAPTSVPINRVNRLEDLADDPHLAATGFPVNFSATPAEETRRHAPRLGEHTRERLAELGYTDDRIDSLVSSGAAITAGD